MTVYQTNALEFTVTSRLGGTQRNPPFSTDPHDTDKYAPADEQNIRHFTVEELGVVDLSLAFGTTTMGVRFVPWIWLNSPSATLAGLCDVVDSESLRVMRNVFGIADSFMYYNEGIMVPQGASLKFGEWEVRSGERPIRLRLSIVPPANTLQWSAMRQAFCCLEPEPVEAEPQ
jgi:hypothetical protein